jgi:hypothetical protein
MGVAERGRFPFDEYPVVKLDHVDKVATNEDKCSWASQHRRTGVSLEDDVGDKDPKITPGPPPEGFPDPLHKDPKFLSRADLFHTFDTALEEETDAKPKPPEKEEERRNEHEVEDDMFSHGVSYQPATTSFRRWRDSKSFFCV